MNVKWIIENGVFPEEVAASIEKSLEENDIDYSIKLDVVKYVKKTLSAEGELDFCIPYGSVRMVKDLHDLFERDFYLQEHNFGIWYNADQLSFGALSSNWGSYLLNQEYVITTIADLQRRFKYFYGLMGKVVNDQNVIFIKPYLNNKAFNGIILMEVAAEGTLARLIEDDRDFGKVKAETLVVVSRPQMVINEWRLFVLDRKVIAATQYNKGRIKHYEDGGPVDEESRVFIQGVLDDPWQPDLAYSLDICQAEDRHYYVMEIGCLNCSDLYAVNKGKFFVEMTDYFKRTT